MLTRRTSLASSFLFTLLTAVSSAQTSFPVSPATPGGFTTRSTGDLSSGTSVTSKKAPPKPIKVSYTIVGELRQWTNTKGASIHARLLAFETGDPAKADPNRVLTLIRDGKIRLLVEGKNTFNELQLSTLSSPDQEYVTELVKTRNEARAHTKTEKK